MQRNAAGNGDSATVGVGYVGGIPRVHSYTQEPDHVNRLFFASWGQPGRRGASWDPMMRRLAPITPLCAQ